MKKNSIVLIIVLFSILVLCSCGLGSSRLEGVFEGTNIVGTHEIYSFAKDGSFRNDYETGVVIGTYHIGEDGSLDIVKGGISEGYTYKLDKDTLMIYPSGETYGSVYQRISNAPQTAAIKKYESDQIEGFFGDENSSYVFNKDGSYRHQYISHRTFSDEICVENGTYEVIDGILTLNNETDTKSYILEIENDLILFSMDNPGRGSKFANKTEQYKEEVAIYNEALQMMENKDFQNARLKFSEISDYFNSEDMIKEVDYQEAKYLYESGNGKDASMHFLKLYDQDKYNNDIEQMLFDSINSANMLILKAKDSEFRNDRNYHVLLTYNFLNYLPATIKGIQFTTHIYSLQSNEIGSINATVTPVIAPGSVATFSTDLSSPTIDYNINNMNVFSFLYGRKLNDFTYKTEITQIYYDDVIDIDDVPEITSPLAVSNERKDSNDGMDQTKGSESNSAPSNGNDNSASDPASTKQTRIFAIANDNINIRIAAGKNNAKVGKIYKGMLVEALECQQNIDGYNWYKVEYEFDKFGWIADNGDWLDFDDKRIDSLKGFFSGQIGISKSEYDEYDPIMHMIGQGDEYNVWYGAAEGAFVYFVENRKTHEFFDSDQADSISIILINYYYEGENIYTFKSMRKEEDVVFTDSSGFDHDAEIWTVTDQKGNSSRYMYYDIDEGMSECIYKDNGKGKFEQIGYSSYY